MKLENFRSGIYKQQYQYKSFTPSLVNQVWTWDDPKINTLLEQATRALSELNAFSHIVPDVDLFTEMHIIKEATTSSKIEGTQTHMDEAMMEKEQIDPERRDDWQEVQNYIRAMNYALNDLSHLPLSSRLLKQTHLILMQSVRGEHKSPGEYRASQNWIGGTGLADAVFVPPHHEEVAALMSDLELFWHNDNIEVPKLIRIAISHYQFETIHPFLDGNGRIGRLLITLYLIYSGFLAKPSLYLSDYFEQHRSAYYDALTTVRASNDLIHWIRFFLVAVTQTAEKGKSTFLKILALKERTDKQILRLGKRAPKANMLMRHLYKRPFINVAQAVHLLDTSAPMANRLIKEMELLGILKELTGFKRNRVFEFEEYFNLFRDGKTQTPS